MELLGSGMGHGFRKMSTRDAKSVGVFCSVEDVAKDRLTRPWPKEDHRPSLGHTLDC